MALYGLKWSYRENREQAGAELCQSRVMLEVVVEAVIKIGIQLLLWLGGLLAG